MNNLEKKQITTIAAISDIHSNVYALESVFADIRHRDVDQVDQIVNLGDILYGPIAPNATYELLMAHQDDIITIRGNQDR
ncbi:metallophosphoesterase family protein, partial [Psychrobacter sp. AOP7-A1-24]|uniref:metallophosphoesterase family protein n=1 Tax=Psychrobacter sp. AOP7-A1-24 TaxID=3457646 RepID=UPI00402B417A